MKVKATANRSKNTAPHTLALVPLVLLACATPAMGQSLRQRVGGYELEVLVEGRPAPAFSHKGESYFMGRLGERYVIRVHNRTAQRIEAVVAVDGRDAVDGKTGDVGKRGYLVPAWGFVDIDGWRLSAHQAAAFRFSRVPDSYAARMGRPRHVGVIGVAVFPERAYVPPPRPWPLLPRRSYDGPVDEARAEGKSAPAPSAEAGEAHARDSAASGASGRSRSGLGTEFGEATHSPIREVHFVRAHARRPAAYLGARYNDRAGLVALGIDVDDFVSSRDEAYLRGTARPFPASAPYAAPPPGWRRW